MDVFLLVKVAALTLPGPWLAENHPLSPHSLALPTPYQLKYEMTKRRLKGARELLEATTQLREAFEQDGPRFKEAVERLRGHETKLREQIAGHEAFLTLPAPPPPPVPLYRPGRKPPPKPPIRD